MTSDNVARVQWFGDPWPDLALPAPVCDDPSQQRPTPVGDQCGGCEYDIADGDNGVIIPGLDVDPSFAEPVYVPRRIPYHKECFLRNILGCYSNLVGQGHDHDGDYRDDALRVYEWVRSSGAGGPVSN